MPRFFFDFFNHHAFVQDKVGIDLADLPSVRRRAAQAARQLVTEGQANREDRSDWVFEIKDEAARTVLTIPFSEALTEPSAARRDPSDLPPAGPQAHPSLTNPDSTPGTGMLPPVGPSDDSNMQPSS